MVTWPGANERTCASGRDQITLVTCTPTGVNSHRLLVHADRVGAEDTTAEGRTAISDAPTAAGFLWWVPILIAGSITVLLVVVLLDRWSRRRG